MAGVTDQIADARTPDARASNASASSSRLGDVGMMLKLMQPLDAVGIADPLTRKRQLLADLCRLIGRQVTEGKTPLNVNGLSPRMEQTLQSLLSGESEKEVAAKLGLSHHTVHVYVKALYKRYGVSSRGELLAKWVKKN